MREKTHNFLKFLLHARKMRDNIDECMTEHCCVQRHTRAEPLRFCPASPEWHKGQPAVEEGAGTVSKGHTVSWTPEQARGPAAASSTMQRALLRSHWHLHLRPRPWPPGHKCCSYSTDGKGTNTSGLPQPSPSAYKIFVKFILKRKFTFWFCETKLKSSHLSSECFFFSWEICFPKLPEQVHTI